MAVPNAKQDKLCLIKCFLDHGWVAIPSRIGHAKVSSTGWPLVNPSVKFRPKYTHTYARESLTTPRFFSLRLVPSFSV